MEWHWESVCQAKVHDPAMVKGHHWLEQEVCVATGHALVQIHITDWAKFQIENPMLSTALDWLKAQKTDLKALLAEHTSSKEGWLILQNQQNFTIHQGALYLHSTPKGETEDLLLFVVPKAHGLPPWIGAIGMWVIRDVTIPCPCCRSISGCLAYQIRCNNQLSPACIACNMRVICPGVPGPFHKGCNGICDPQSDS